MSEGLLLDSVVLIGMSVGGMRYVAVANRREERYSVIPDDNVVRIEARGRRDPYDTAVSVARNDDSIVFASNDNHNSFFFERYEQHPESGLYRAMRKFEFTHPKVTGVLSTNGRDITTELGTLWEGIGARVSHVQRGQAQGLFVYASRLRATVTLKPLDLDGDTPQELCDHLTELFHANTAAISIRGNAAVRNYTP
ncbi:hypothetical protein ACFL0V_03200 [Nanoarchaeota archaeon]